MIGVRFDKAIGKWQAQLNGYLGSYNTEDEARAARVAAEIAQHGYAHDQSTIEISGEVARVPLFAAKGRLVGWATIDAADVHLVENDRWNLLASGYAVTREKGGAFVFMHRRILPGEGVGDHINGVRLDNRRANLRRCSQQDNSRNKHVAGKSRSGFKGVRETPEGRFAARIMVDRKEINLGRFDTAEAAARAYDDAARECFGDFASVNFQRVTEAA